MTTLYLMCDRFPLFYSFLKAHLASLSSASLSAAHSLIELSANLSRGCRNIYHSRINPWVSYFTLNSRQQHTNNSRNTHNRFDSTGTGFTTAINSPSINTNLDGFERGRKSTHDSFWSIFGSTASGSTSSSPVERDMNNIYEDLHE